MLFGIFLFFVRYIPFWTIPLLIIAVEYLYFCYKQEEKRKTMLFLLLSLFSLSVLTFYILAGGSDGAVRVFLNVQV